MKEKIKLEEFFEFGKNQPIQRLAYSKNDVEYKLQIIKKMKSLGMKVKIDKVGNICATLEGNGKSNKSILMCSHTDSVKDGGQYDGPAGVVSGLKVIENVVEKVEAGELELDSDLKVVVWACEESARFGKACLGSKWVEGSLQEEDFSMKESIKDKKEEDKQTLKEAIAEYIDEIKKSGIEDIEYVDKVLEIEEIVSAYELHIEQYQYLAENNIDIGAVSSITAPYRMGIKIDGKDKVLAAAKLVVELNNKAKEAEKQENGERYRATVPVINIEENIGQTNALLNIELEGEADHSGATPMDKRKDPILTASKFVLKLNNIIEQDGYSEFKTYFNSISTSNDSMNKVAKNSNITLGINTNGYPENIIIDYLSNIAKRVASEEGIKVKCEKIENIIRKNIDKEETNDVKLDVRMQTSTNSQEIFDEISNMIIDIAKKNGNQYKWVTTDEGKPIKTSENLVNQVHEVCKENNITSITMKSWAGHDITHLSLLEKILIFIKSTGGSHNPNENTTKEDIEKGITALTGTVVKDIENIHDVVNKVEDLEKNPLLLIASSGQQRKREVSRILSDVAKARKFGIPVSRELRVNLRKEIISSRMRQSEK